MPTIAGESGHLNHEDSNDIYFDVFVTTAAELPGVVAAALVINRFGRKYVVSARVGACIHFHCFVCLLHTKEFADYHDASVRYCYRCTVSRGAHLADGC